MARQSRVGRGVLQVVFAGLLLARESVEVSALAPLEPTTGAYFGISGDYYSQTLVQASNSTGLQPVVYDVFVPFPLDLNATEYFELVLPQIASLGAIAMLTIQPFGGFQTVTDSALSQLTDYITQYSQQGAKFMVRFAHEMNGDWYQWGQQPTEYISAFQMVASAVRAAACDVAMVWSPNTGYGYPWPGNGTVASLPAPGTPNFEAMDTNGDGQITQADDPYTPFYPGDDAVDWVGMSVDHFGGSSYPYIANERCLPNAFSQAFNGQYTVPSFYGLFCSDGVHNKPMIITETSAMYNPSNPAGDTDFTIKSLWWEQVFNVGGTNSNALDMSINFPRIGMVLWFNMLKQEAEADYAVIDWRFSGVPAIQDAFVKLSGRFPIQLVAVPGGNYKHCRKPDRPADIGGGDPGLMYDQGRRVNSDYGALSN